MSDLFSKLGEQENQNELNIEQEKKRLKAEVQKKLPGYVKDINLFGLTDEREIEKVKSHIREIIAKAGTTLKSFEVSDLVSTLILDITSLGKLTPLVEDPTITEIMINGPEDIWIERKGKLMKSELTYRNNDELLELAQRIVRHIGRNIDQSHPEVDARLPDGSRVHIIIPPLARKGVTITIRKFFKERLTAGDLIDKGTMTTDMAKFLKALVFAKTNIIISGGTGSGKTTTLNVVSNFIPPGERIITIEDSAELQLAYDHIVSLEKKEANAEKQGEFSIQRLVRAALRMRPDRIVVGEVRDETAYDLLNAMNTGHEGSMSTIHANDPKSSITRLTNLVKQTGMGYTDETIETLIGQAVDVIVQISRVRDGSRRITYISIIDENEEGKIVIRDIYRFKPDLKDDQGNIFSAYIRTKEELSARIKDKMVQANINWKKL